MIPVNVPLLPQALKILDKYKANIRSLSGGKVFPVMSNQKVNSYLKEISEVCNITKNVTFHLAKHTFATTITLSNGVPIETVSKMLGHKKITTTQIYAKVVERKLKEDMQNFRLRLSPQKILIKVNHSDNKGEAFSPLFKVFSINFTATHIVAHREIAYGL
jgi:integrase